MSHRVFQVGVGKMGLNHVKTIELLTADKHDISLCGVCDINLDALIAFRAQYPHIKTYLVRDATAQQADFNATALPPGIEIIDSVATGIVRTHANTLMNCTNNNSHIPVLKDALSLRDENGATVIRTVFQEKPFAHHLQAALEVAEQIRSEGITFSLNSILEFSPIWNDYHRFLAENPDLALEQVMCAYGKDRTQDTRPAQGGWVGLEGIHALDISSVGLQKLQVSTANITATRGFLAPAASENGHADFAIDCKVEAQSHHGKRVPILINGSFAWQQQHRSTLYIFDGGNEKKICMQVVFDKRSDNDGQLYDELRVIEFDLKNNAKREVFSASSNGNKLYDYYLCTITPDKQHRIYGLDKALSIQKTLDQLGQPAKVLHLDAASAPKTPAFADIADISPAQLRAWLAPKAAPAQAQNRPSFK